MTTDNKYHYPGLELEVFQQATNWKQYFASQIIPFLGTNILEVGAGLGATTKYLKKDPLSQWTMLEPDKNMYEILSGEPWVKEQNIIVKYGTTSDLSSCYDTILYIDVLEHIEEDALELEKASALLSDKGRIIVLSPAFNNLYSPFDKAIGHFRRYTRSGLQKLTPPHSELIYLKYLDSLGYFASMANKVILHQDYPKENQILFWDKKLIPITKKLDKLFSFSFGKSILAIWQKN